jgi:hypothetical protein
MKTKIATFLKKKSSDRLRNCNPGCPTGNVSNCNCTYFGGGQFIFDTEDGLIANWTGASKIAAVVFDNSQLFAWFGDCRDLLSSWRYGSSHELARKML